MTLIGNVCRNQGDQSLIQSLQDVLTILKPAALSARPEPVELTTGDRTMSLPRETLEFVQSELAELGFYTSVVDGLYGPGTRRAIEGFQRDRGLEVTGLPNDGLIVRLAFSAGRSG
jgi:peptidoglycan hydrolase-like protein with peptidoglycan-binding domain